MKTVLLVPGFQEDLETNDYQTLLTAIEKNGYAAQFIPIDWKRTAIDDWVAQLNAVYTQYEPKNTVLAGFSYGAMTVLLASSSRLSSELWLFSLSPYFSEDIPLLKLAWLRNIGKQRTERFWRVSFQKIAPTITCRTLLFIGEKEVTKYPVLAKRVTDAHRDIANAEMIIAAGADHDVTSPAYVAAIANKIAHV